MNFYARGFNLYLLAAVLLTGCAKDKGDNEKLGTLRIHVESRGNLPGGGLKVSVLRAQPVVVTISENSILSEANLLAATLIDSPGGFAIKVKFDENASWILEQNTSANPGRHLAIFGHWGDTKDDGRWLAAPIISRRIADGTLVFTPDATREEALELVTGLNAAAKKIHNGTLK
jgi:preprotein translocase subunit SecD